MVRDIRDATRDMAIARHVMGVHVGSADPTAAAHATVGELVGDWLAFQTFGASEATRDAIVVGRGVGNG